MELQVERTERYFIVVRSKKGLSRGCIGYADAETDAGCLVGKVYGGCNGVRTSATVKKQDTYPLSQHQAQLLLFVSPASRRLELLCNAPLFSAICDLAQDDVVVVRHKKAFQPCLVKSLTQITKKDNLGDLQMLGFELEFVNIDQDIFPKKTGLLPLFSAADIVQVATSHSNQRNLLRDGFVSGQNKNKNVSRTNSMPAFSSQKLRNRIIIPTKTMSIKALSHYSLEVGSVVEVTSGSGTTLYGVIRWIGIPEGEKNCWAGLELENELATCSNGMLNKKQYFTCDHNRALFLPLSACKPDSRFTNTREATNQSEAHAENEDEDVPPVPESEFLSLLMGRMRGIQGHFNSCYLDVTLFSLFTSSTAFNRILNESAESEKSISQTLKRDIVNPLRRSGFVPAESVMNFRKQLGCKSFATEEKDAEEFISVLLQHVLHTKPLLKLRSNSQLLQEAFTHQIIVEKNQMPAVPSVQQLFEMSFISSGIKFEEIPSSLIVQMPRFGKKFKMFPKIIPSTELDITDFLHRSPRECFLCACLAEYECVQCHMDHKLQPSKIKQYCSTCNTQVHKHPSRHGHTPQKLPDAEYFPKDGPVQRHKMQLFAVICIDTSHYVSFVKYGPDPRSWIFFDSMADRCGDDSNGHNVPVIRACPDVGNFLSQSEVDLSNADTSQSSELVRRLLADSYMCLYQSTENAVHQKMMLL